MATTPRKASLEIAKFVADPSELALSRLSTKRSTTKPSLQNDDGFLQNLATTPKRASLVIAKFAAGPADFTLLRLAIKRSTTKPSIQNDNGILPIWQRHLKRPAW